MYVKLHEVVIYHFNMFYFFQKGLRDLLSKRQCEWVHC